MNNACIREIHESDRFPRLGGQCRASKFTCGNRMLYIGQSFLPQSSGPVGPFPFPMTKHHFGPTMFRPVPASQSNEQLIQSSFAQAFDKALALSVDR